MTLTETPAADGSRRRAMREEFATTLAARRMVRPLLPKISAWQLQAARVREERRRTERGYDTGGITPPKLAIEIKAQMDVLDGACAKLPKNIAAAGPITNVRRAMQSILVSLADL